MYIVGNGHGVPLESIITYMQNNKRLVGKHCYFSCLCPPPFLGSPQRSNVVIRNRYFAWTATKKRGILRRY